MPLPQRSVLLLPRKPRQPHALLSWTAVQKSCLLARYVNYIVQCLASIALATMQVSAWLQVQGVNAEPLLRQRDCANCMACFALIISRGILPDWGQADTAANSKTLRRVGKSLEAEEQRLKAAAEVRVPSLLRMLLAGQ